MGRPISHRAHRTFVEREGWEEKGTGRSASRVGDHHRYTLTLANGEVLYTRVSHGSGQIDDSKLIESILHNQLHVTEEEFWACVDRRVLPRRPTPDPGPAVPTSLDTKLMRNLIAKVGLTAAEVEGLSKEEAVERWHRYLIEGGA